MSAMTKREWMAYLEKTWDAAQKEAWSDQQPTKIFGPNLEGILNSAGFYKKREWVSLTDEEHDSIKHNYHNMTWTLEMFAKAIEQALKEKNHG